MKVKLTKDQLVGPEFHEAGTIVEVDGRRAEQMIRDKAADRVDPIEQTPIDSPPDASSREHLERTTGRPTRVPPPELTGEINPVAPEPGKRVVKKGATETSEVVVDDDKSVRTTEVSHAEDDGSSTVLSDSPKVEPMVKTPNPAKPTPSPKKD